MDVNLLLSQAQIYAFKRYQYEEQSIIKAINALDPNGEYKEKLFSFEEFKEYIKINFEDYYTVICLMWKGDDKLIEQQLKDDYIALCHLRNGESIFNKMDSNKENLRMMLAFTSYWCDYRINHITKDALLHNWDFEEINHHIKFFAQFKEECLNKLNKLLTQMHKDVETFYEQN